MQQPGANPPEPQAAAGLAQLPHFVVAVILDHLINPAAASGSTAAAAAAAASAGLRSVVALAFSSKAMLQGVAAAEPLWRQQCQRLGWSLAWLPSLPPGTSAWEYFCRRMAVRHRLRFQLRALTRFLDPLSAAAIRPGAPLEALREAEAALQMPLPWQLFELYRFCDGQSPERGGIQFLDAARLLSLREMLQATQDRHGPLETARAFAALLAQPSSSGDGAAASSNSEAEASSRCYPGASSSGSSSTQPPWADDSSAQAPAVLLPFTDELRGRKRFAMDLHGRVWLASGWHTLPVADSLHTLIRRVLT